MKLFLPFLKVVLSFFLISGNLVAQYSNKQLKFNYALSKSGSSEVMIINEHYALIYDAVYLNVYSLQTGLFVKKILVEYHDTPMWRARASYKPDDNLQDNIYNYYTQNYRFVNDPELVPAPNWKQLYEVKYTAYVNDTETGVSVFLGDGTVREFVFDIDKVRGEYHYCEDRNSLVVVKADPKIGIIEVNDKNEIKAYKSSGLTDLNYIRIEGSKVVTNEVIFDLSTGKMSYDLRPLDDVTSARLISDRHMVYRSRKDGGKVVFYDLVSKQKLIELPASMSHRSISAEMNFYVELKESFNGYNLRAFVKRLDGGVAVELVCPQSIKDYEDAVASNIKYEAEMDLNRKIFREFMADPANALSTFNNNVANFKHDAEAKGWKLISHTQSGEKGIVNGYVRTRYNPSDSVLFRMDNNYWVINLCALPMLRSQMQFWQSIPNWPWIQLDSYSGYGVEFTHDYFILHSGVIHPEDDLKFDVVYSTEFHYFDKELNFLAEGVSQTLIFEKPANSNQFDMPEFAGTVLPQYYFSCFDERYESMKEQYKANIIAEAERARVEALKKIPQFSAPEPGSALYNLQMAIDAAVPTTWNTCSACGGTGLSSSRCACCSGQGSIVVKRQVFHEMSQKTDVVYKPDGEQGAGYYSRTTPIGYYKTESSYQNCECCSGSGILTGTGVCGSCGGAGRIKP